MELTVEQKIQYSTLIAKILMTASFIFIGFGAVVKIMQDAAYGNWLMEIGLVFIALLGVSLYVKKTLTDKIEVGKTFHGGK